MILRPEPGATATADRAKQMGIKVHAMPLFQVRALDWQALPPDAFDAVLVTSANAVRYGGAGLNVYHDLPLFAVGDASAAAARTSGFKRVSAGSDDGPALVRMAVAAGYNSLLHFCGHQHKRLSDAGADITAVQVYSADVVEPPPAFPADNGPFVTLVHSPRAAQRLAEIVPDKSSVHIVAISAAAAQAAGSGWAGLAVAALPTDAAMLEIAAGICERSG